MGFIFLILLQFNTPNPNPLRLDSRGHARIYLQPKVSYKLVLYAPGNGPNSCLGSAVGVKEWEIDNVAEYPDIYHSQAPYVDTTILTKDQKPAGGYMLCSYKAGTSVPIPTYREPYRTMKPK